MVVKQRNRRMERAVVLLLPEISRMAALQQTKIVDRLAHAPARLVEAEAAYQIRTRHARRKARLQQKRSRRINAR